MHNLWGTGTTEEEQRAGELREMQNAKLFLCPLRGVLERRRTSLPRVQGVDTRQQRYPRIRRGILRFRLAGNSLTFNIYFIKVKFAVTLRFSESQILCDYKK